MAENSEKYNIVEKEDIISECMPYIKYTAARLSWRLPPSLSEEDLVSAGIVGLLEAVERYDPNISKPKTYLEYRIKGAMLDLIEKNNFLPKQVNKKVYELKKAINDLEMKLQRAPEDYEIAEFCGISLEEYYEIADNINKARWVSFEMIDKDGEESSQVDNIPDNEDYEPQKLILKKNFIESLTDMIEQLSEKEKLVLNLYYYDELTMKEISRILGITEGRVCQLHNQAILKLKTKMLE